MKRGFLKGGLEKRSSKPPTSQPRATDLSLTPEAVVVTASKSTVLAHRREEPILEELEETGHVVTGFGGPSGSVDTIILTLGLDRNITIEKHHQYHRSVMDELSVFNAERIKIDTVPGKGLGMFAKNDISPGEIFLRERPLFVAPKEVPKEVMQQLPAIMEKQMSRGRCKVYWRLHNCRPRGGSLLLETYNIYRTNCISIILPFQDESHSAVFEAISRANHSCTPNTEYLFDYDSFCGEFQAMLPIKAGEEILIPYIYPLHAAEKRRTMLKAQYLFTCDCTACDPASVTFFKSEERRKRLLELLPPAIEYKEDVEYVKTLKSRSYDDAHIERMLRLLDKERLPSMRPYMLLQFAKFERFKGRLTRDFDRAIVLAGRAIDVATGMGHAKKSEAWFELHEILEYCRAQQRPERMAERLADTYGSPDKLFDVDAVLRYLEATQNQEYARFKKAHLQTPESIARLKEMVKEQVKEAQANAPKG